MKERSFIITIDTEGDYIWNRKTWSRNSIKNRITVRNGKHLGRFQKLCEKYGFKPTWLVDYEMCASEAFVEMARDGLSRGTIEIGMHMHAWTAPPYYELMRGKKSGGNHPYIGEYPREIIEKKVGCLTDRIVEVFGTIPRSHRSGRWYLDKKYAEILIKHGYVADCSVTPGIDWRNNPGLTERSCGIDYRDFPTVAYEMDVRQISKPGKSGLYEIPLSTMRTESGRLIQLRPYRHNINDMLMIVKSKAEEGGDYLEFMLHSSELMRAGSPNFLTESDIEVLYLDLEKLFSAIAEDYTGKTLTEYARMKFGEGI